MKVSNFQNLWSAVLLCGVAGCALVSKVDPPFDVSRQMLQIDGVVWSFEATGQPVIYGGPVGLITSEIADVITIDAPLFELTTASNVLAAEPQAIANVIQAATAYCEEIGEPRDPARGAQIHTVGGQVHLVGFCPAS